MIYGHSLLYAHSMSLLNTPLETTIDMSPIELVLQHLIDFIALHAPSINSNVSNVTITSNTPTITSVAMRAWSVTCLYITAFPSRHSSLLSTALPTRQSLPAALANMSRGQSYVDARAISVVARRVAGNVAGNVAGKEERESGLVEIVMNGDVIRARKVCGKVFILGDYI